MTRSRARARSGSADRYGMLERAAIAAARRNGAALWYLGRDLSSVFGDAKGTVAPSVGGGAGLLLDRAYGLNAVLGPEMFAPTSNANWTSLGGGAWQKAITSWASLGESQGSNRVRGGGLYRVSFTVSGGSVQIYSANASNNNDTVGGTYGPGTYSVDVTTRAAGGLWFDFNGASGQILSGVSIREITSDTLGVDLITNGSFTSDASGWLDTSIAPSVWQWVAGKAQWSKQAGDASNARLDQSIPTIAGRTYRLTVDIGVSTVFLSLGTAQGGAQIASFAILAAGGTRSFTFVAQASTTWVRFVSDAAAGSTGTVDNVSVREVLGGHLSQGTSASRPTVTLLPSGYYGLAGDDTNDWLTMPAAVASNPSVDWVVFAGKVRAAGATNKSILGRRNGTTSGFILRNNTGTVHWFAGNGTDLSAVSMEPEPTGPTVYACSVGGGFRRAWVRGVSTGDVAFTYSPATAQSFAIGSDNGDGFASGGGAEWLALAAYGWQSAPSDADRIAIERFGAFLAGAPYTG